MSALLAASKERTRYERAAHPDRLAPPDARVRLVLLDPGAPVITTAVPGNIGLQVGPFTTSERRVETQPTIYMFGHREKSARTELTGGVARWLRGEDVQLTPSQLIELRREFTAQEQYRQVLLDGIMRVSKKLSEQGAESTSAIESPAATHRDVYWSGFAAGQVEAYGTSAAAVSELHVIAALGVE